MRLMASTRHHIGALSLELPDEFEQTEAHTESFSAVGPPGSTSVEIYRAYANRQQWIHVFWWLPRPPCPGGPLVAADQWTEMVNGSSVQVIETSQFMGIEQTVLVVHLKVANATGMIYARGMTREAFALILRSVQIEAD